MKKTLIKFVTLVTLLIWTTTAFASSESDLKFIRSLDKKDSNWCYKEVSMIANFTYKNLNSIYWLNPKFEIWNWLLKEYTKDIMVDWKPWKDQVVWRAYYQENKITIDCDYYNTLIDVPVYHLQRNNVLERREILEKVSKVIAHEYYHLLSHKMNEFEWWIYDKRNERPWNIDLMKDTVYTEDLELLYTDSTFTSEDFDKINETITRMKNSWAYDNDNEEVQADLFWEYFFYKTNEWWKVLLILNFLDNVRFITFNPMYWPIDIKQIIESTNYDLSQKYKEENYEFTNKLVITETTIIWKRMEEILNKYFFLK